MTVEDLKSIKGFYTKDNTIIIPDGREFIELRFALKAYGLSEEEFLSRLEKGASVREAFCGMDLPCGLVYGNDGYLAGGPKKYKTLEDMCADNNASVYWFEELYKLTGSVSQSLVQTKYNTTQEYLSKLRKEKEAREQKEANESKLTKKLADEKDKEFQKLLGRLSEAKSLLSIFVKEYVLEDNTEIIYYEKAKLILSLLEFVSAHRLLTADEKKLSFKLNTRLDIGLRHTPIQNPLEARVIHIISGLELGLVERQLRDSNRLRDVYINKLLNPSDIVERVYEKELMSHKRKGKYNSKGTQKRKKPIESPNSILAVEPVKKRELVDTQGSVKTIVKKEVEEDKAVDTCTIGQIEKYQERTKKLCSINSAILGGTENVYQSMVSGLDNCVDDTDDSKYYAKIQQETIAVLKAYSEEFTNGN